MYVTKIGGVALRTEHLIGNPTQPSEKADPIRLKISGMTCASCQARIQRTLKSHPGVSDASVNLVTGQATIWPVTAGAEAGPFMALVEKLGYGADGQADEPESLREETDQEIRQAEEYRKLRGRAMLSLGAALLAMLISMPLMGTHAGHGAGVDPFMAWAMGSLSPWLESVLPWIYRVDSRILSGILILATLTTMAGPGRPFYVRAYKAALQGGADMNTLVAIGTLAAFTFSLAATFIPGKFLEHGLVPEVYYETVLFIIALILFGNTLEARARRKTAAALRALAGLQPDTARVLRDSMDYEIPVRDVAEGDLVLVRPGERIPVDGVIDEGSSGIDESMITGESMSVRKGPGEKVVGGSINRTGALKFRAADLGERSVLSRIVKLMREAQGSKAPIQMLADRISGVFVPLVLAASLLTFFGWWIAAGSEGVGRAVAAAVAVLIIACPCAMGLAVPTAILVSTGRGASAGILVKGGEALQRIGEVDTVVLDKTGTLTEGNPTVESILPSGTWKEEDLLRLAASVEFLSEHPLAAAVVAKAKGISPALPPTESFQAYPGMGATGVVEDRAVAVGNLKLMAEFAVDVAAQEVAAGRISRSGGTPVFVAVDGEFAGLLGIADRIRPTSAEAVASMRRLGLRVVLLSGDRLATAQAVARQAGIDEVMADVTPEGKVLGIERLKSQGARVAMVGDGINDAPALARADVGVAMGSGTDIAMEAGDITLMRSDLNGIVSVVKLGRKTMRVIRQNLFWAFVYNALGIPLAAGLLYPAFGILLSPVLAGAAMAFSSVSVVANSLRLKAAVI